MKKLLIYPFTKDLCPLVRYRKLLAGYELVAAIAESGYGWENVDVGKIDGGQATGFLLGGNFTEKLAQCDTIFLNESACNKEDLEAKRVLIQRAKKELIAVSKTILPESNLFSTNFKLREIPIPVVMVMGLGENCQKFELQLGLREEFIKAGYKVSQFGTKAYSGLFGFEPLPEMPNISLSEKVYCYNNLFYKTILQENPDIIIIGVPGGVMPIADYASERFGETALALSHATKPDIALMSCYFVVPTDEYLDMLRNFANYRLGISDVIFHMSNINLIPDNDNHSLSFLTLKSEFVINELTKKVPGLLPSLFHVFAPETKYSKIIETLQDNIEVLL